MPVWRSAGGSRPIGCANENGAFFQVSPAQCALAGGLFGAGTGTLVGMVIGSFSKIEQRVDVPAGARR